jgi:hypothetical protein
MSDKSREYDGKTTLLIIGTSLGFHFILTTQLLILPVWTQEKSDGVELEHWISRYWPDKNLTNNISVNFEAVLMTLRKAGITVAD